MSQANSLPGSPTLRNSRFTICRRRAQQASSSPQTSALAYARQAFTARDGGAAGFVAGGLLGFLVAAGVGYGVYRGAHRLPVRQFFSVSGIVVIVLAAELLSNGLVELMASGLIPQLGHVRGTSMACCPHRARRAGSSTRSSVTTRRPHWGRSSAIPHTWWSGWWRCSRRCAAALCRRPLIAARGSLAPQRDRRSRPSWTRACGKEATCPLVISDGTSAVCSYWAPSRCWFSDAPAAGVRVARLRSLQPGTPAAPYGWR